MYLYIGHRHVRIRITKSKVPDLHLVTGQHTHSGNTRILHKFKVRFCVNAQVNFLIILLASFNTPSPIVKHDGIDVFWTEIIDHL